MTAKEAQIIVINYKSRLSSIAPPPFEPPRLLHVSSDSVVMLRLYGASEKHGPVSHYHVVVVKETGDKKEPDHYQPEEVN